MIKNYLVVFFRNISRNKTFTILNAGGFALGMAACILIALFIANEQSFDKLHSRGERIFRLNEWQRFDGMQEQQVALSMYPMAPALLNDHPEVETFVRVYPRENTVIRNPDREIFEHNLLVTDSNFFEVFDFSLLSGNRSEALKDPNSVVITASVAKSMFGSTNAVGQSLEIKRADSFYTYKVSAVANDPPVNSHIRYDLLIPLGGIPKKKWMLSWETNWLTTYLLLKENVTAAKLEAALPVFKKKYLGNDEKFYDLVLQPFFDIHLHSGNITHDNLNDNKFSATYIKIFMALAIAILVIAIFNFINLSTAIAVKRTKEAGVRKAIGAGKWQLVLQFTSEAVLLSFISFAAAILITMASLPLINSVFNRNISFGFAGSVWWPALITAVLFVGLISGLYPAWIIAKYKPVTMVKGAVAIQQRRGFSLRPVLVVLQFTTAVGLIISAIIITRQLRFVQQKDLGFDKEQVLLIRMNTTANRKFEALKNELLANNNIDDLTAYSERLGANVNQWGADYIARSGETKHISVSHLMVDYNYIPFFRIQLAEGRNFSISFADTGQAYIINEALAKQLDVQEPVGSGYKGSFRPEMGKIIAVAKDFNFNSLHHKVAPLYISIQNFDFYEMAIRLKPGATTAGLNFIKTVWNREIPDMPFDYTFLDDHMNGLYLADRQTGIVVSIATLLAIIVACLGLFGMALYTIESRVREIGIRKVLGASVQGIALTLSKKFLLLVLTAAIISFPLSWLVMNQWLEDFAYRVSVQWWVFGLAGLLAMLIAAVTVSFQAIKAAIANPIKSLRTE